MNKIINTSYFRSNLNKILTIVKKGGNAVIGKYDEPIAVLVPFPSLYNNKVSDMTNVNVGSGAFDFLSGEPEVYSLDDVKCLYEK